MPNSELAVLFIGKPLGPNQALLEKMASAMGLQTSEYQWLDLTSGLSKDQIQALDPKVIVVMDEDFPAPANYAAKFVRTLHPSVVALRPET